MRRFSAVVLFAWLAASWTSPARAQEASAADKAASEALFDDARKLMQAGKYAEACAKFSESQRLDAGVGTLLYLADCYEKDGRLASGWATFREAAAAARSAGQAEREKIARDRAAQLEPRLTKMVISVPHAIDGLEIRRDKTPVGRALWGSAMPVDAGAHTVEATAPGYKTWKQQVDVSDGSPPVTVEVPALEPAPASAEGASAGGSAVHTSAGSDVSPDSSSGQMQSIAGYVVAGVGLVGLGAGAFFWQRGGSKHDEALDHCKPNCDETAKSLQEDAEQATTIGNIAMIGGGALLVGGVVLVLTAPSAKTEARFRAQPLNVGGAVAPAFSFEGTW
jgi:serine/threonine-protein kinase